MMLIKRGIKRKGEWEEYKVEKGGRRSKKKWKMRREMKRIRKKKGRTMEKRMMRVWRMRRIGKKGRIE